MNELSLYGGMLSNLSRPISGDSNTWVQPKGDPVNIEGVSFKEIINNEIEKVNNRQIKADELTKGFISGEVEDLHSVLIATEEARLSLELAVQVRNKCIEAFREINNIQL